MKHTTPKKRKLDDDTTIASKAAQVEVRSVPFRKATYKIEVCFHSYKTIMTGAASTMNENNAIEEEMNHLKLFNPVQPRRARSAPEDRGGCVP